MHIITQNHYWEEVLSDKRKIYDMYVHIPKTSGLSLIADIKSKYNIVHHITDVINNINFSMSGVAIDPKGIVCDTDLGCLHHPTINQLYRALEEYNMPRINFIFHTLVRNPYLRICSAINYHNDFPSIESWNKETFHKVIEDFISRDPMSVHNHNIPQIDFMYMNNRLDLTKIHVFKVIHRRRLFQYLFESRKPNSLYQNIRINISNQKTFQYFDFLDSKSKKIINQYYKQDFINLNFEMM